MHPSITFSLQLMHLPDANTVKNCSPFLCRHALCWLSGRALWQILWSFGCACTACQMQSEMLGYPSPGPDRTEQSLLEGLGIDPSHLQGSWLGASLLPTFLPVANLPCDTPPVPQLAFWIQKASRRVIWFFRYTLVKLGNLCKINI